MNTYSVLHEAREKSESSLAPGASIDVLRILLCCSTEVSDHRWLQKELSSSIVGVNQTVDDSSCFVFVRAVGTSSGFKMEHSICMTLESISTTEWTRNIPGQVNLHVLSQAVFIEGRVPVVAKFSRTLGAFFLVCHPVFTVSRLRLN